MLVPQDKWLKLCSCAVHFVVNFSNKTLGNSVRQSCCTGIRFIPLEFFFPAAVDLSLVSLS